MDEATKQRTCEERIDEHKVDRVADFRVLTAAANGDSITDDDDITTATYLDLNLVVDNEDELMEEADERIHEYPLGVSVHKVVRVELSYGGPQDYLEAHVDDEGDITRITYHFLDWFDGAVRTLEGDEFDAAEAFIGRLVPLDCLE